MSSETGKPATEPKAPPASRYPVRALGHPALVAVAVFASTLVVGGLAREREQRALDQATQTVARSVASEIESDMDEQIRAVAAGSAPDRVTDSGLEPVPTYGGDSVLVMPASGGDEGGDLSRLAHAFVEAQFEADDLPESNVGIDFTIETLGEPHFQVREPSRFLGPRDEASP